MASAIKVLFVFATIAAASLAKKPELYYFPASPSCQIVRMTANVLRIDLNMIFVNILSDQELNPEFLKINPQHTIPTLNDNGLVMSESRAIAAYLADSSPEGEKLYPKNLKKRTKVDEMLYFDAGRLYRDLEDAYEMVAMGLRVASKGSAGENNVARFEDSLAILEHYLSKSEWAAGDQMTLADLSLHSTVSTAQTIGHNLEKYPKIVRWLEKTKAAIPDYQAASQDGLNMWKDMVATIP